MSEKEKKRGARLLQRAQATDKDDCEMNNRNMQTKMQNNKIAKRVCKSLQLANVLSEWIERLKMNIHFQCFTHAHTNQSNNK